MQGSLGWDLKGYQHCLYLRKSWNDWWYFLHSRRFKDILEVIHMPLLVRARFLNQSNFAPGRLWSVGKGLWTFAALNIFLCPLPNTCECCHRSTKHIQMLIAKHRDVNPKLQICSFPYLLLDSTGPCRPGLCLQYHINYQEEKIQKNILHPQHCSSVDCFPSFCFLGFFSWGMEVVGDWHRWWFISLILLHTKVSHFFQDISKFK